MSVIHQVLSLLENNRGTPLSGETMAQKLGVSRNAVWQAVKKLQAGGYPIQATTNRGYILDHMCSILSKEGIEKYLSVPCHVIVEQKVSSTNTVLKQMADQGAPHGTVLVAAQQTAGRGRMGRSFFSPDQSGIYMSILLRPHMSMQQATMLTVKAAVAVARAIDAVSHHKAKIKWVNDIYVDDKKVCGILTEASTYIESGQIEYAVVGIGVNITFSQEQSPADIRGIAGGLFETAPADIRNRLAGEIIHQYFTALDKDVTDEYRSRSWLDGAEVTVMMGNDSYPAQVIGIDKNCALLVKKPNGEEALLSSGEVRVRKR